MEHFHQFFHQLTVLQSETTIQFSIQPSNRSLKQNIYWITDSGWKLGSWTILAGSWSKLNHSFLTKWSKIARMFIFLIICDVLYYPEVYHQKWWTLNSTFIIYQTSLTWWPFWQLDPRLSIAQSNTPVSQRCWFFSYPAHSLKYRAFQGMRIKYRSH